MFKQFTKKLFLAILGLSLATISYASAHKYKTNIDGAIIYPTDLRVQYIKNDQVKGPFHIGKRATKKEIAGWNIDIRYDGKGLYIGHGSVSQGEDLYANKCVKCHGDFGAGGKGYPVLAGGDGTLKNQRIHPGDDGPLRTVGSYWPYATTLLWYIKTGMPQDHPNSLTNDQAYAIASYILSLNDITVGGKDMGDDFVLSNKNFMKIHLPNQNGFIPKDKDLKHFLNNPNNPYLGKGNRCMKNCAKKIKITQVVGSLTPKINEARDLPKLKKSHRIISTNTKGAKIYNTTCVACHGSGAMGAPKLGDSVAWDKVIKQGMSKVYNNALNGIGNMPAKGGNSALSDADVKSAVDYMVDSSK
jgi:cytochrome c